MASRAGVIRAGRAASLALSLLACTGPNERFEAGLKDAAGADSGAVDAARGAEVPVKDGTVADGPSEASAADVPTSPDVIALDAPDASMDRAPLDLPAADVSGPGRGGLVLHWRLDELAGTTAADSSGNGLHGSHVGPTAGALSPEHAPTNFPNAGSRRFTSADQAVVLTSTFARLRPTAAISVSLWFRTTATARADLFSFNSDYFIRLMPPEMEFTRRKPPNATGSQNYINAVGNLPTANDDRWHHVVGTSTPELTTFWFDGVRVASDAAASPFQYTAGMNQVVAGRSASGDRTFPGWLDDVRIYDRVLTADEIRALAAGAD